MSSVVHWSSMRLDTRSWLPWLQVRLLNKCSIVVWVLSVAAVYLPRKGGKEDVVMMSVTRVG